MKISIIIPCKNEEKTIGKVVDALLDKALADEIIVINDGSSDGTAEILESKNVVLINHPYSKGNGASIKAGARKSTCDILIFMDADGQHNVHEIPKLITEIKNGYDMVVGARDNASQASTARLVGNKLYNRLASLITGHKIYDLTSGFRACNRKYFIEFLSLLPNGFSYPTTITMAFFRSGYSIKYIPIKVDERQGKSHLSLIKDGIRFLLIIFKVGTLYSPLKLFAPLSALIFSSGIGYYLYTYLLSGRFTNMSLLLLVIAVFIFIFGLISEQITMLTYLGIQKNNSNNK
jgi:glycosyltransferase involved in cell wall biosynthesis